MSVRTTFDEKKDSAKEAIDQAIKNLHECIKPDTWGYDQIQPSYIDELFEIMLNLTKIKRKLWKRKYKSIYAL